MDEGFIFLLKSNPREGFNQLFDHYFHPLCSFGYRYIDDPLEVEDMVQEVFVKFWESAPQFSHPKEIRAFLYTSVRNKCLNHIKHLKVRLKNEGALIYELESEHFFSNRVISEETFNLIHQEIADLPGESQKIMLLVLNGLKNKEIADKFNISENTVKTQKKIAYAKLRTRLGSVFNAVLLAF